MRLLLDTHIYLWWLTDSPALGARARELVARSDAVYVSTVSIWESGIKWQAGKLPVPPDDLVMGIERCKFVELPITSRHAVAASRLPPHHLDPFDRMLVAQTIAEPMHLLTSDKALESYSALVQIV